MHSGLRSWTEAPLTRLDASWRGETASSRRGAMAPLSGEQFSLEPCRARSMQSDVLTRSSRRVENRLSASSQVPVTHALRPGHQSTFRGRQATCRLTTQQCFSLCRSRSKPCCSNIATVPSYKNEPTLFGPPRRPGSSPPGRHRTAPGRRRPPLDAGVRGRQRSRGSASRATIARQPPSRSGSQWKPCRAEGGRDLHPPQSIRLGAAGTICQVTLPISYPP